MNQNPPPKPTLTDGLMPDMTMGHGKIKVKGKTTPDAATPKDAKEEHKFAIKKIKDALLGSMFKLVERKNKKDDKLGEVIPNRVQMRRSKITGKSARPQMGRLGTRAKKTPPSLVTLVAVHQTFPNGDKKKFVMPREMLVQAAKERQANAGQ